MPEAADRNTADRHSGLSNNMHPRKDGTMILKPEDVLEGIGNFLRLDEEGNPVGWRLGRPEQRDGRRIYIGTSRSAMYRQTRVPLNPNRPSHVVDYELAEAGQLPPTPDTPLLAPLPRPPAPQVVKIPADSLGYPASTPASPYWYAWALVHTTEDGDRLTFATRPVPFHLEHGQSFEVLMPENVPPGLKVAFIVSEPGQSRPDRPGPMYVQHVVDPSQYLLSTYPLTGPYRRERLAANYNETEIPTPTGKVVAKQTHEACGAKVAKYQAHITFTDASGETLISTSSDSVFIYEDDDYTYKPKNSTGSGEKVVAGRGKLKVIRPREVPPTATGWRARVYMRPIHNGPNFSPGWFRIVDKRSGTGGEQPFPLSRTSIECAGWTGDEEPYGVNERVIMEANEPPTKNTTGIPGPDETPEVPNATGAGRPEPDKIYHLCVTDTLRGIESLPSDPVTISDLQSDEVMAVLLTDESDLIPNSTFVETDNAALPLYWRVNQPNGHAAVYGQTLRMQTTTPTAPATPTPDAFTPKVPVDPTQFAVFETAYAVEEPPNGLPAGAVEFSVRQYDATGTVTKLDWIHEAYGVGEYEQSLTMHPAQDPTPGVAKWLDSTVEAEVMVRFASVAGSNKNQRVRLRRIRKRLNRLRRRLHRRNKETNIPTKPPGTVVQYPPEPPIPPETGAVSTPDRPLSDGEIFHSEDFENGLAGIGAPFAPVTSGTATIDTIPAASLGPDGTLGLVCKKTTPGTLSSARLTGGFDPEVHDLPDGRHCLGMFNRYRFPTFPTNGTLVIREILDSTNTRWIARLEASHMAEKATLTIDENPTQAGTTYVTLNGARFPIEILEAKQTDTLDLSSGPTEGGSVQVELDSGKKKTVLTGGTSHECLVGAGSSSDNGGYVLIRLDSIDHYVYVPKGKSRQTIAWYIANESYPGWSTSIVSDGYEVLFKATQPEPKNGSFEAYGYNTRTQLYMTQKIAGSCESISSFAARLAANPPSGWTAVVDSLDNTKIHYTATVGGMRPAPNLYPGSTGVAGTWTVAQGSIDTREQLAAKYRAIVAPGWTISGSSRQAIFTATAAGARQTTKYSPGSTGAAGTVLTSQTGADNDLAVIARDKNDVTTRRVLISNITPTQIIHADLAVSGAKRERAIVTAWAGLEGGSLKHKARIEDLDLTGVNAHRHSVGVSSESSADLTWEVHVDALRVTERGLRFYRDHTSEGEWIGQVVGYYPPSLPTSQDLLLQDASVDVFPGREYTLSLYARPENPTSTPAKLLIATARSTNNTATVVAIAGEVPATHADSGWAEYTAAPFTVPEDCYRIDLASRDIGGGHYVIQEVVCSEGSIPKRTHKYAPAGSYSQILDITTPDGHEAFTFWQTQRTRLAAPADVPTGTTIEVLFRSGPSTLGPWSPFVTDPTLVPEDDYVEVRFNATCPNANDTPEIKQNSPSCEWDLKLADSRRMSTLLDENRGQLPGGAAFRSILPWSKRDPAMRMTLPSGRLYDDPSLFEPVGYLPESVLWLFNSKALSYLAENWRRPFYIEAYGELLLVLISAPPGEPEPQTAQVIEDPDGTRHSLYEIKLPSCEVLQAVPLARPPTASTP